MREDLQLAVLWWLSVREFAALPVFTRPEEELPVDGGEEEEETVDIPNHFGIVQAVDRAHPQLIATNSKETVREFYWRAAVALHAHDPKWGMLSKSASENHQLIEGLRVSVDAVAYQGATPIVDILTSAGDGPGIGGLTWGVEEHRRAWNVWVAPPPFVGVDEDDEDDPPDETPDLTGILARLARLEREVLRYGSPVVLRTDSGNLICAEGGGGGEVNATRRDPGAWETLTPERP